MAYALLGARMQVAGGVCCIVYDQKLWSVLDGACWQINGCMCYIVYVGRSMVACAPLCIVADQFCV